MVWHKRLVHFNLIKTNKITKITIIVVFALISSFVFARGAFRSLKTSNFCVQEFRADREFHELTRQGGKLSVL